MKIEKIVVKCEKCRVRVECENWEEFGKLGIKGWTDNTDKTLCPKCSVLNCGDCKESDFFHNDARSCDGPYSTCVCEINGMNILNHYKNRTRPEWCPLHKENLTEKK